MTRTITNPATPTINVPLNRLYPATENVRRTGAEAGLDELAASIQAHGLLQNLNVRREVGPRGAPTGRYFVVAGGRRLLALRRLAAEGRIGRTARIPCRVVEDDQATEASLAENVVRVAMHPADQFEAFARLANAGQLPERIAERFGVSVLTVRQRLRLAAVAPSLLDAYRNGELTLDAVTAFAVTDDHEAQERVWRQTAAHAHPATIRRLLTEGRVLLADRRVRLVGLAAYEAAGGVVDRDLFDLDEGGGWIADPGLLDRLVEARLMEAAEAVRVEGWRWVEVARDFPQDRLWRMRRVQPEAVPLTEEQAARQEALAEEYDAIVAELGDSPEGEAADRLETIEAELAALEAGETRWTPDCLAVAGAVVCLDPWGEGVRIERGFVRTEDAEPDAVANDDESARDDDAAGSAPEAEEERMPSMSGALRAELLAHRTAALRATLAERPDLALRVTTHGMALAVIYRRPYGGVVRSPLPGTGFDAGVPGVEASKAAVALSVILERWRAALPTQADGLWAWIEAARTEDVGALLAACVGASADAGNADWTIENGTAWPAARAATLGGLDPTAWWSPTRASYLDRVPKALILEAVREGAGEAAACRLAGAKKDDMAETAARLLAGKGWVPSLLRVPATMTVGDEATVQIAAE
ncbi:ParB/RepB/Spo0J family partition protein [Falsiroseomonas tokyonensis]|uniref:ParB/RepB/Spo0J family partition protein n=1 Tax=Falsiroseomonas tokyonensis TaxID=430521 RepID=A0ABV7C475_9PROT|nr:ParB/RepB/Spo0J family partition protein [Falsiroseomonas tokyonensis]